MNAGDLAAARDYLTLAAGHARGAGGLRNLAASLQNLALCLGRLGLAGPARRDAIEALTNAEAANDRDSVWRSHALLGWLAGLAEHTAAAGDHFTTAGQIHLADYGEHLSSHAGVLWAQWLARTGRRGPARPGT
jgi:hypothetical protein